MKPSIKLPDHHDWFDYNDLERKLPDQKIKPRDGKSSVDLGEEWENRATSLLPEKLTLTELLEYNDNILAKYILNTNTFFHGKVGFHEYIIRKLFSIMGEKNTNINYLHTLQNLPREKKPDRLILLPTVKSEDALNDFVAKSLCHRSRAPVWLIGNPSSIHKHLLLCFHNFFVASNNQDELMYFQSIFSLPKEIVKLLLNHEKEAVFITDFEEVLNRNYLPIAIVRISSFE